MDICGIPFNQLILHPFEGTLAYVACCASRNRYPYDKYRFKVPDNGEVFDIKKVWNSKELIEFRRSILDGSYKYCDEKVCPFLSSKKFEKATEKALQNIQEKDPYLKYFPPEIAANIDSSCNLCCPSCRSKPDRKPDHRTYHRFIEILKSGVESVSFNSSGELFFNRHFLKIMREFSSKDFPALKNFRVITNGTLLNRTMWFSLSDDFKKCLSDIDVSVDTFSEETYKIIRPGSSFKNLQKNVKIISEIRESGEINNFNLRFVLQKKNHKELVEIVKRTIELKPDSIVIQTVCNWHNYSVSFFEKELKLPDNYKDIYAEDIQIAKKMIQDSGIKLVSDIL